MSSIRIMTHNLWKNDQNHAWWAERGEDCSAAARIPGFLQVYRELMPDIIGCQEVSQQMADKLMIAAAEEQIPFALLWGRDTPIIYRRDKLQLLDSDFALYPERIDEMPGCFNNAATKSYCIAVFQTKASQKCFVFATTHLWYRSGDPNNSDYQPFSNEARKWQLQLLMEKVSRLQDRYACPAVIVGDMNADYNSLAVQSALKQGFVHGHDVAREFADETMGYHNCSHFGYEAHYFDKPFANAIDHIFLKGFASDAVTHFRRYSPDYYLPLSDHSPAFVDIEF